MSSNTWCVIKEPPAVGQPERRPDVGSLQQSTGTLRSDTKPANLQTLKQQASVTQQITQQQRDQQKQNAEVIQKTLRNSRSEEQRLTTAQQVPVVGGAAQQQPAPGSNEAMTREVTDPSAGRDVTKWASVMKSGKTEALIHGIRGAVCERSGVQGWWGPATWLLQAVEELRSRFGVR